MELECYSLLKSELADPVSQAGLEVMSKKVIQKRKKGRLTGPELLRSSSRDTYSRKGAGGKFKQKVILKLKGQTKVSLGCWAIM